MSGALLKIVSGKEIWGPRAQEKGGKLIYTLFHLVLSDLYLLDVFG
jgi:hypothetical protein